MPYNASIKLEGALHHMPETEYARGFLDATLIAWDLTEETLDDNHNPDKSSLRDRLDTLQSNAMHELSRNLRNEGWDRL